MSWNEVSMQFIKRRMLQLPKICFHLDAAIALGGAKQPLDERRPSSASSFCSKTGVDPSPDGGGGAGGGGVYA